MTMAFAGHYNETDGWRAVLYKAWVLKNGSLGPAVSMQFISMQL